MKKHIISFAILLLGMQIQALAQDNSQDVYLCIDERGHKEYKNTGITKGCKKVDLPAITTFSAPVRKPAREGTAVASTAPKASSPADFPKVDSGTQKKRDNDSRHIFEEELRSEEAKLANYKKEFNNGQPERRGDEANFAKYQERVQQMRDDIARTEKNIEALKRELANVKM